MGFGIAVDIANFGGEVKIPSASSSYVFHQTKSVTWLLAYFSVCLLFFFFFFLYKLFQTQVAIQPKQLEKHFLCIPCEFFTPALADGISLESV